MPITGIYFIPSHPNTTTALPTLTERLRTAYPEQDLVPAGRWALEHKLMRDTPGLLPASPQSKKPRYMQFLTLSHYPSHGFIYASEPAEKPFHPPASTPTPATPTGANAAAETSMVMTTVPPSSYGTLFQHFVYAAQPFWCHRLTMAVPAGVVYEVGDFRVRMGDVRQTYPTARVRGTVVEIEWLGPSVVESVALGQEDGDEMGFAGVEEADVDAEYAATAQLIREFWTRLRFEGAREAILVPGVGKEVKEKLKRRGEKKGSNGVVTVPLVEGEEEDPDPSAGTDVARQYMEVLRFNR
ncbi:Mediator complex subunit Med20 [Penicillium cinerascens]|uniref:Mediator of RNA polymerase II transcription subunit 20 n=1 Tax=Penicillium cinerascens TaxID=70096 RepID=A0A9W9NAQ5_9EURO|nr:Mediator complex subunit Med20 [Penicillium cinerascens]KAJ5216316.1 Mediator complex subunit Med20 [Penicillium cinerascens]